MCVCVYCFSGVVCAWERRPRDTMLIYNVCRSHDGLSCRCRRLLLCQTNWVQMGYYLAHGGPFGFHLDPGLCHSTPGLLRSAESWFPGWQGGGGGRRRPLPGTASRRVSTPKQSASAERQGASAPAHWPVHTSATQKHTQQILHPEHRPSLHPSPTS